MEMLFRQSGVNRDVTLVTRSDGVRLSVPVVGKLDPLPHDLAHVVLEDEWALHDGFWGSVAAGAIFEGMRILGGRQRSRALMKAHHQGILFSEIMVDVVLRAVNGEPLGTDPLPIASPNIPSRTRADRDALIWQVLPAMQVMCDRWQATPPGATLLVVWPDQARRQGRVSRRAAR